MILTKKKKAAAAAVAVLAAVLVFRWVKKPARAPEFQQAVVERGDVALTVSATGVVQPRNRLEVKPPIGGRVESVQVKEGDAVRRGQVLAWMSSTERAALLDAARAKGAGELAHWEEIYKPAPLVSPSDGVLIARKVEPGQTVTSADALFVVSDRLIVKAQVDETDIGRVKAGLEAVVTLDAYPDPPVAAKVEHIAYEAETVNNVTIYQVDVRPGEIPDFMRSGMTANVTFVLARKEGVLLVPTEAVRDGGKVLQPSGEKKGRPRRTEVTAGLSDGRRTEIVEGLKEGDVVLIPSFNLPSAKGGGSPFMPSQQRGNNRRAR
jgi:membrane fusion protein, macrolide-specific efflux system